MIHDGLPGLRRLRQGRDVACHYTLIHRVGHQLADRRVDVADGLGARPPAPLRFTRRGATGTGRSGGRPSGRSRQVHHGCRHGRSQRTLAFDGSQGCRPATGDGEPDADAVVAAGLKDHSATASAPGAGACRHFGCNAWTRLLDHRGSRPRPRSGLGPASHLRCADSGRGASLPGRLRYLIHEWPLASGANCCGSAAREPTVS